MGAFGHWTDDVPRTDEWDGPVHTDQSGAVLCKKFATYQSLLVDHSEINR
jgi:hypothetical protein